MLRKPRKAQISATPKANRARGGPKAIHVTIPSLYRSLGLPSGKPGDSIHPKIGPGLGPASTRPTHTAETTSHVRKSPRVQLICRKSTMLFLYSGVCHPARMRPYLIILLAIVLVAFSNVIGRGAGYRNGIAAAPETARLARERDVAADARLRNLATSTPFDEACDQIFELVRAYDHDDDYPASPDH